MTSEPVQHPGARPRFVLDTNVLVSAAIASGVPRALLQAATDGRFGLVVSPHLLDELYSVLRRPKFRPWLSLQAVDDFLAAVTLLAESHSDLDLTDREPIGRDPDDEYLISLAADAHVTYLVSGDLDLLSIEYGPVIVRGPAAALESLDYRHPWIMTALRADSREEIGRRIQAEGHEKVLAVADAILGLVGDDLVDALSDLATPESLSAWMSNVDLAERLLSNRAFLSRPVYPTPDVAYVKIIPKTGDDLLMTADVVVPDAMIMTLQRRPELPGHATYGGWRMHAVGGPVPLDQMPVVTVRPA